MEIPRWWWEWWFLLVIYATAVEISPQSWGRLPRKTCSGHFHCAKLTGNENEFTWSSAFLLVWFFKTYTARAVSFHRLLFVNAGILKWIGHVPSTALAYSSLLLSFISPTVSFFYYSSGCVVNIKAWQAWDKASCHLIAAEKNDASAPAS